MIRHTFTTKQFYYTFIVITFFSALSILVALYLGSNRLAQESKITSQLLAERDVAREKLSKLTTIANQAREAQQYEETVTSIIPKNKEQQTLVAEIIYKATSKAQIDSSQIMSFNFSGSTSNAINDLTGTDPLTSLPGVYEYPFSITLSNISYDQLLKLFAEIESNQRLIQVSTADITPSSIDTSSLDVNLVMKAYVQP